MGEHLPHGLNVEEVSHGSSRLSVCSVETLSNTFKFRDARIKPCLRGQCVCTLPVQVSLYFVGPEWNC